MPGDGQHVAGELRLCTQLLQHLFLPLPKVGGGLLGPKQLLPHPAPQDTAALATGQQLGMTQPELCSGVCAKPLHFSHELIPHLKKCPSPSLAPLAIIADEVFGGTFGAGGQGETSTTTSIRGGA